MSAAVRSRLHSPVLIFVVALFYRIAVGIHFFRVGGVTYQWTNEIAAIARSIVLRHSFAAPYAGYAGPTAWIAPAYPTLVAAVFWIFGVNSNASGLILLLLNALFSSLTAILIYKIGREYLTHQTALFASWAFALSPTVVLMPLLLWDTSLSALMLTLSFLVLLKAESMEDLVKAGFLWGLSALVSPSLLAPLPLILIAKFRPSRTGLKFALAFCAAVVLTLLPWSIRNRRVMHAYFPVRSDGWAEIYFGNVTFDMHPCARSNGLYQQIGETRFVQQLKGDVIRYIRENPGDFLQKSVQRWGRFWIMPVSFFPLTLALALLCGGGAALLYRTLGWKAVPFLAVPLLYPIIYSMTHIETRYRHPMEPIEYLLAAYCASAVIARFRKNSSPETIADSKPAGI